MARPCWGTLALALLFMACSTSRSTELEDGPSPASGSSAPSSRDPAYKHLSVEDAPSVRLKARQLSLLHTSVDPDWMVAGFGSLWIKRDDGSVLRMSPHGKQLALIDPGPFIPPVCQGIGVTSHAVWACSSPGEVMRIDPATNHITSRNDVNKVSEQGRLIERDGLLRILVGDGDQLIGLTEEGQEQGDPIPLDAYCTDLAAGGDQDLFVVCPYDGVALRVDPAAGKVTGSIRLPGPIAAAVGDDLWVVYERGIARIDTDTMNIEATYHSDAGTAGSIIVTDDGVWVRAEGAPFLTRIDPVTGEVVETLAAPDLSSGGDVIAFDDKLWATAYDDKTIVSLRPR